MPFAVESGGEAQASAVGLEPLRRCPCPALLPNPALALDDSSQGSISPRGSPADVPSVPRGAQGGHQGCPWLPREPPERVFPGSCHSAIELSAVLRTTQCL